MCPVALRCRSATASSAACDRSSSPLASRARILYPGRLGLEPADHGLGPLGRQQRLMQWLQPAGGALGLAAEQPGQPGCQHAPCAASLVIQPVLVAAVAADRPGRAAGAPGAQVLAGAAAWEQAAVLSAAGAVIFGAHRRPVAGGARRAVRPDHRHLTAVTAVGAFPFRPGLAASAQHLPRALTAAWPLPAAHPAPGHGARPAASAQFRVISGRQADDDAHPPAPPAGPLGPGVAARAAGLPASGAADGRRLAASARAGRTRGAAQAQRRLARLRHQGVQPAGTARGERAGGTSGAGGFPGFVGADGAADTAGRAAFVRVQVAAVADPGAVDGDAGPAVMAADAAGFPRCGVGAPAPLADRPAVGVAGADPGLLPAAAASLRQVVGLGAGGADALPVGPVGAQNRSRPQSGHRGWATSLRPARRSSLIRRSTSMGTVVSPLARAPGSPRRCAAMTRSQAAVLRLVPPPAAASRQLRAWSPGKPSSSPVTRATQSARARPVSQRMQPCRAGQLSRTS